MIETKSLSIVVVTRYVASKILDACVKIKWTWTEESSPEGGVQGLMKYIKTKHTVETPIARNKSNLEAEPFSNMLYINVYTEALIPT